MSSHPLGSLSRSDGHSYIPRMLSHVLGSFNLHSPLRWSVAHSLNAASFPRQLQFIFPAPAVTRRFLECCLMPLAISIYILHSGGHSHIPEFFLMPLAIQIYFPLLRSLVHLL